MAAPRPRRNRPRWLVVGAVGSLVAGIVVLSLVGGTRSARRPAVAVTGPAAAGLGSLAPVFSLPTLSGSTFVSSAHRPILLYFMAGWCGTCVPEAEALARLQPAVGQQVAVVAVDADPSDSWSSLRSFAQSVGSPSYVFAKDDGHLDAALGINSLDITIVLDRAGRVAYRNLGALDDAGLRAALGKIGVNP